MWHRRLADGPGRTASSLAAGQSYESYGFMKTLGMMGGVRPESTIDYYGSIVARYRQAKGDGSYPQFLVNSINMNKGRSLIEVGDLEGLTRYLVQEIEKLGKAGADFGLIAANTPHLV